MKAVVWTAYGTPDVLQIREMQKPVPKDNELLIRMRATTVTAGDCELRNLDFPAYLKLPMRLWLGFARPRRDTIPGTEIAGEIEAVGKSVTAFKVGDHVFGAAGLHFGACAEYICLPEVPRGLEGGVAIKPASMTHEEAAAVPFGGRDALHFLRKGNVEAGQKILIIGAGGSIGTFAIQLAKHLGCEVTAVDSTEKLAMLRSLGADHVIDYTKGDSTGNGEVYDVIFDVVGKNSIGRTMKALKKNGCFLMANPRIPQMIRGLWTRLTSERKVVFETSSGTVADLTYLRELIDGGELKSVIDRYYPLEQLADAHRYVETGRKQGNVIITIGQAETS